VSGRWGRCWKRLSGLAALGVEFSEAFTVSALVKASKNGRSRRRRGGVHAVASSRATMRMMLYTAPLIKNQARLRCLPM
jgi:hypothetical protein